MYFPRCVVRWLSLCAKFPTGYPTHELMTVNFPFPARDVPASATMKTDPASRLVSSCIRHMSTMQADSNYGFFLENEFARFKLWNHGFDGQHDHNLGAVSSQLDKILSYSVYYTEPTIILLANMISCLLMREFAHGMGPFLYPSIVSYAFH